MLAPHAVELSQATFDADGVPWHVRQHHLGRPLQPKPRFSRTVGEKHRRLRAVQRLVGGGRVLLRSLARHVHPQGERARLRPNACRQLLDHVLLGGEGHHPAALFRRRENRVRRDVQAVPFLGGFGFRRDLGERPQPFLFARDQLRLEEHRQIFMPDLVLARRAQPGLREHPHVARPTRRRRGEETEDRPKFCRRLRRRPYPAPPIFDRGEDARVRFGVGPFHDELRFGIETS